MKNYDYDYKKLATFLKMLHDAKTHHGTLEVAMRKNGVRYVNQLSSILRKDGYVRTVTTGDKSVIEWIKGEPSLQMAKMLYDRAVHWSKNPIKKAVINDDDFERFWRNYPKKESKKKATIAWQKCKNKPDIDFIMDKLEAHKKTQQWNNENGKYIPYPASYINQERWNDELNLNIEKKHNPVLWAKMVDALETLGSSVKIPLTTDMKLDKLKDDFNKMVDSIDCINQDIEELRHVKSNKIYIDDLPIEVVIHNLSLGIAELSIEISNRVFALENRIKEIEKPKEVKPKRKIKFVNPIKFTWRNPFKIITPEDVDNNLLTNETI